MQRFVAMMLAGGMALCAGGCAANSQDAYEFAQRYIGIGEYETAAEYFEQLGEYRDSADYLLYVDALMALEEGETALARANFEQLGNFKSSQRYLQCIEALEREAAGDYDGALKIYQKLGTFAECHHKAARMITEKPERERAACRKLMDAGEYEQALEKLRHMEKSTETAKMIAECETSIKKDIYKEACALQEAGKAAEALIAFAEIETMLDVPARMAACRSDLYLSAVGTEITIETIPALVETYALLGDYLDSMERMSELENQMHAADEMMGAASGYIRMGSLVDAKTGKKTPVIWRIGSVENGRAVLHCETAAGSNIEWTEKEERSVVEMDKKASGVKTVFEILDTPYRKAQGCIPVTAEGVEYVTVRVDFRKMPFVSGAGTAEHPYVLE